MQRKYAVPTRRSSGWIVGRVLIEGTVALAGYIVWINKFLRGIDVEELTLLILGSLIGLVIGILISRNALRQLNTKGVPVYTLRRPATFFLFTMRFLLTAWHVRFVILFIPIVFLLVALGYIVLLQSFSIFIFEIAVILVMDIAFSFFVLIWYLRLPRTGS